MAATLDHTALITVEAVRLRAFGSFGPALSTGLLETRDVYAATVDVIHDLTDRIEARLSRALIVRRHAFAFRACDWRHTEATVRGEENVVWAYAPAWPVVQVASVDGSTDADVLAALSFDEGGPYPGALLADLDALADLGIDLPFSAEVFAGYRRRDQELADLPTGSGEALEGLTEEPPVLPDQIHRVAVRLALAEIRESAAGMLGVGASSTRIEDNTVDYERHDTRFEERELATLTPYRKMPMAGARP